MRKTITEEIKRRKWEVEGTTESGGGMEGGEGEAKGEAKESETSEWQVALEGGKEGGK